jgi:hypothetical protein
MRDVAVRPVLPLVLILLLGALPGVAIVADTAQRKWKRGQIERVRLW